MPPDQPAPITRRVVRAVGLIDASVLANPLWDPRDVHAELVAHHAEHPDLPLRALASPEVRNRLRQALSRLPRPRSEYTPPTLVDELGWLGVVALWSPLTASPHSSAAPDAVGIAESLTASAERDREFWRAHGFLPPLAYAHIHTFAPADPLMLGDWEQRRTAQGEPAVFLSMPWEPRPLDDLIPAVVGLLDVACHAAEVEAAERDWF